MKLLSRLRQIAMVGGVESLGVVATGVTGLLIVNVLPKEHYAVYTFLITCMQLMMGIADLGLSNCALPIVGQRHSDAPWVVGVCRQIFHRRWLMLGVAGVIVVPYAIYTFSQHGWISYSNSIAACLMVAALFLTLRGHYANNVLLILGDISTISRIGGIAATTRFSVVCAALLLPLNQFTLAGLFLAVVVTEIINLVLYRRAFRVRRLEDVHLSAVERNDIDRRILKLALPLVPSAIFFQIQGVVTVFLVSLFGTSTMLAEIGAFGRLAMVLTILDRMAGILLFPAIARAPAGKRLASMVFRIHLIYFAGMGVMLFTGVFFSEYWILFLGEKYRNLTPYVWMIFLGSILMNAAGFAFLTMSVRGMTSRQGFSVIFVIVTQMLYLWLVGVSDLKSVLFFNIATCAAHFIYQYILLYLRRASFNSASAA